MSSCMTLNKSYTKSLTEYNNKITQYRQELKDSKLTQSEFDNLCAQQGEILYIQGILIGAE